MNLLRRIYHKIIKQLFHFNERFLKLHILPVHYYSPIPDSREIKNSDFSRLFSCTGIQWNVNHQIENLTSHFCSYQEENTPATNSGLSLVDAQILFSFIRKEKPKIMIEIGSGESTLIALSALNENKKEGDDFQLIAIEPYPNDKIKNISDPSFELVSKKVQDIELDTFDNADLLFIDSSHVSKFGSDVNYEILEIVPNLKKGASIHKYRTNKRAVVSKSPHE